MRLRTLVVCLSAAMLCPALLADTYVPVLIKDYPTGGSAAGYINDQLSFSVEATDSGGNLAAADWYVDSVLKRTDSITGYYSQVPAFVWSFAASGTHNISITIRDTSGNAAYGGWSVTIGNRAPTASYVSPSSSDVSLSAGSSLQFTVAASDPDGNLSYVEWYRDNSFVAKTYVSGSAVNTARSETFNSSGTVKAIVYDVENAYGAVVWNVTANCPGVGSFSLTSPPPGATLNSSTTSVPLNWSAAAGASGYDVYFGTGASPGVVAANVTSTSQTVAVSSGQTYSWKVRAFNACGSQAFSPSSGYQSFSVASPTGDLSATVRNLDGSLKSGAICKLYDSAYTPLPQDRTSVSGVCSWVGLPASGYHVEVWNPSTSQPLPGDEFWRAAAVTVAANTVATLTVQRVEPYVAARPEFRLNDSNGRLLSATDHVYAGQTIFVKATVLQQAGFSQTSTVRMAFDYLRDSTYDYDTFESAAQNVASGGSGSVFTFSFAVPPVSGSVALAFGLRVSTLASANWSKTDGWSWTDAFIVDDAANVRVEPHAIRAGNTCPLLIRVSNLGLPIDGTTTVKALKNGVVDPAFTFTVDTSDTSALYVRGMCASSVDRATPYRALSITSGGLSVTRENALKILPVRSAVPYNGPYVWETTCSRISTFLSDTAAARAEVRALKAQGFRTVFLQTDCQGILGGSYDSGLTAFLDEAQSVTPLLDVHAYAANGHKNYRSTANAEAKAVVDWNSAHNRHFQGIHLNFEPLPAGDTGAMFEALDTTADIADAYESQTTISLTAGSKGSSQASPLSWRLDTLHAPTVDYCDASQFAGIFIPQAYLIDAGFAPGPPGNPAALDFIDDRRQFLTPVSGDETVDASALSFLGISDYDRVTAVQTTDGSTYAAIPGVFANYYVSSEVRFCGEQDRMLTTYRQLLPNTEVATTYSQGVETHVFTVGKNTSLGFVNDDGQTTNLQSDNSKTIKLVVTKTTSIAPVLQHIPDNRYAGWHAARLVGESLDPPTSITATPNGSGILVSWQYTCTCMTGFTVERKVNGGNWTVAGNVPVDLSSPTPTTRTASYQDSPSGSCSWITYRLKTYNAISESAYSGEIVPACSVAPLVTTGSASAVGAMGATLNGTVNPNGSQATTGFDYGLTTQYGSSVPSQTLNGSTAQSITASVVGLNCGGVTYHFRAIATNTAGSAVGGNNTFVTANCGGGSPLVVTGTASDLTATTATLNATVDPSSLQTTTTFEYGRTTGYGSTVPAQQVFGTGAQAISAVINGLECGGVSYHFRARATNIAGSASGSDSTFVTAGCTAPPHWYDSYDFASRGVVAYWPFDDDSFDKSGNGNQGSWTSGGGFVQGRVGHGYSFAPGTYYNVASPASSLRNLGALTIATWVYCTAAQSNENLIGMGLDGVSNHYYVFVVPSLPGAGLSALNSNGQATGTNSVLVSNFYNQWHHIVATYDGSAARFYVDGVMVASQTATGSFAVPSGTPFYINRHDWSSGSSSRLTGVIDEAVVFNRALSATEIGAIESDSDGDGIPDFWTSVPAPTGVVATSTSSASVNISWNAVPSATSYTIYRRGAGGGFTRIGSSTTNSFTDGLVTANNAYLYKVSATTASGTSLVSSADLATTTMFSDEPLTPRVTIVRAAHVTELRTAVNAVRALAGLAPYSFTDSVVNPRATLIKAIHISELRSALDAARAALGLNPASYSDVSIGTRGTLIRAAHLRDLRTGVQ